MSDPKLQTPSLPHPIYQRGLRAVQWVSASGGLVLAWVLVSVFFHVLSVSCVGC